MTIGEIKRFKGTIKVMVNALEHDEIYVKVSKAALLKAFSTGCGGMNDDTPVEAFMLDAETIFIG